MGSGTRPVQTKLLKKKNIFGANVLKPRFKTDVVIMIICSIVIIINSVLTLGLDR